MPRQGASLPDRCSTARAVVRHDSNWAPFATPRTGTPKPVARVTGANLPVNGGYSRSSRDSGVRQGIAFQARRPGVACPWQGRIVPTATGTAGIAV